MSSPNTPQDPYGAGDERDRSSGSTPPPYGSTPPPYGSTPPPPSGDSGQTPYGSTPPPYGSTPPAYGSAPAYGSTSSGAGSSSYGSTPPAYGGDYGTTPSPYGYGTFPKNNLGVWSLVLGLLGIFVCGLFAGIPAVIVGGRAKRAVAEGQANNGGMATAGVVLGWIAIVLSIIGVILALTVLPSLTETATTDSF
jgi:hypothetical protein